MPARSAFLLVGDLAPCAAPASPTGLRVAREPAGLRFTWANVAGAADYVVREDVAPTGAFETITGVAASGTTGLTAPVPGGQRFYLVSSRNACGESPLRN